MFHSNVCTRRLLVRMETVTHSYIRLTHTIYIVAVHIILVVMYKVQSSCIYHFLLQQYRCIGLLKFATVCTQVDKWH